MMNWNSRFNVNIPEVDQQHHDLFDMINTLSAAMKEGRSKDILGDTLNGLIDYARSHFATEEQLFAEYNYPNAQTHKAKHDEFVAKIGEFNEKLQKGSAVVSIEMIQFLSQWLLEHIKVEDQQYATFFTDIEAPCVMTPA